MKISENSDNNKWCENEMNNNINDEMKDIMKIENDERNKDNDNGEEMKW